MNDIKYKDCFMFSIFHLLTAFFIYSAGFIMVYMFFFYNYEASDRRYHLSWIQHLIDFDRTKNIVLNQDSLITNLESTVNGKDKVIVTLRTKEGNYESIIQKQVQQQDNYKIMVEGLKGDIKKLDRKNKINKLTKFGMGFLILGLAVTHK